MAKLSTCLVLLLLVLCSNALFDTIDTVQKVTSASSLAQALLNANFLTVVYFYRNTPRAEHLAPLFIEFAEKNKDSYRFVAVDCELVEKDSKRHSAPACRAEFSDSLPQLLFLEPQEEHLDPIQHKYKGPASLPDFEEFAKKIMPDFSKRLVSLEDLDKFLADKSNLNKVLFLSKKNSVPQYWKALTSRFRGSLSVTYIL